MGVGPKNKTLYLTKGLTRKLIILNILNLESSDEGELLKIEFLNHNKSYL
jgi:hypothetical protein